MLTNVLILKMRPHSNLPLKATIAYRTVVGQCFSMRGEMFGKVILPEESFLTNAALVGFDASVPHLVSPHVGSIRELHVANITLEQFSMHPIGRWIVVFRLHLRLLRRRMVHLVDVGGQRALVKGFKVAAVAPVTAVSRVVIGAAACDPFGVVLLDLFVWGCR